MKDVYELELPELIKEASEVLGFEEKHLSKLLNKDICFEELDLNKLSITSYIKLTKFYYLSEINFRSFYTRQAHKRKIGKSISERTFEHSLNTKTLMIFYKYLVDSYKNDIYCSRRLKVQNLLNKIFNTNIQLPTYEDIFPYKVRKVLYIIKKEYSLKRHIFTYGDYRDFCYFDRRYDPEWKCNSTYYRELFDKNNRLLS